MPKEISKNISYRKYKEFSSVLARRGGKQAESEKKPKAVKQAKKCGDMATINKMN